MENTVSNITNITENAVTENIGKGVVVKNTLTSIMEDYERASRTFLDDSEPVIIRIDGKSFYTAITNLVKLFDDKVLLEAMRETMLKLCENISGCVFGYTQSYEITLVLASYKNNKTEPWFKNDVQKICSNSAAMATLYFNNAFNKLLNEAHILITNRSIEKYRECLYSAIFDARAFNVKHSDVPWNLVWRQRDAMRNSIQRVGHAYLNHKQMVNKNPEEIVEMLKLELGIWWEEFPTRLKRGSACYKVPAVAKAIDTKPLECLGVTTNEIPTIERMEWRVDTELPVFSDVPEFIERFI